MAVPSGGSHIGAFQKTIRKLSRYSFISPIILFLPCLLFKSYYLIELVYSSHKINTSTSNA